MKHEDMLNGVFIEKTFIHHVYCEIIYIRKTFNFMKFVGRAMEEFKITTK